MMRRSRAAPVLVATLAVLSCAPPMRIAPPPAGQQPTELLRCELNAQSVGGGGGRVQHPRHEVNIPRGALPADAVVNLRVMGGDTTGVRVTIEPAPTAAYRVIIDARRCTPQQIDQPPRDWRVWRVPAQGPLVPLQTTRRGRIFTATVPPGNSGFIIAN